MKIAFDAGHGSNTYPPDKGVPQMAEFIFNSAVVRYAKELAENNGFHVVLTQPLVGNDTPLINRTDLAAREKVDLLISFHADANADRNAEGHWPFYWDENGTVTHAAGQIALESKKLAEIWCKHANNIMKNRCRGVRKSVSGTWSNFHMTRVPVNNSVHKYPSILAEHAFMTNPKELKLLLSDDFRRRCAEVAVRTICEYFGRSYKALEVQSTISAEGEKKLTPLNLDKPWMWDMLTQAITEIDVEIDKTMWLSKIKNKTITQDELAWLNTIMLARRTGVTV